MNYYPTLQSLNDYLKNESLNQSFLKKVLTNNNKKFKETLAVTLGSYLDGLLTTPYLVDEMFQIGLAKRPSDAIKGFLDTVLGVLLEKESEENISLLIDDYKEQILIEASKINYQPKWGPDAIWNSIKKDGEDYWNEKIESKGKLVITKEEHDLCTQLAALTLSSPITAKYFIDQKRVDIYYQLPLYWTYLDEPCKGLLDMLLIEHETKTIYIVDLKSTGVESLEEWFRIAFQKKYNFQLSFYKEGVEQNFKELLEQNYTVQCRWMVIPTNTQKFKPWIIPCTNTMLDFGKSGFMKHTSVYYQEDESGDIFSAKKIKGWVEAIETYKRAKSENLVDFDLRWFDYQGKLPEKQSNKLFFN